MTVDMPAARRAAHRFVASRFMIRVGTEWSSIRAATIWPIADVVDAGSAIDAALPQAPATGHVLDLVDSGMIAPPRSRRRRERPVSSRAVFYHSART